MSVERQQVKVVLAGAAQAVPGVAYLSPELRERVRRMLRQHADSTAGVQVFRDGGRGSWRVEVSIAVRAGHRPDIVACAVRAAAIAELAELEPGAATQITVIVTAVV
ncbi:Asp23/Gls24 family envelope stress response protein [Streptomyces xanthophaeus]|uniref:Asp23/Gls24 family envelope stress response protein n=1 Tax=Streptomyces xanthophaeus TaxID=67385 RepID=UPI00398F9695